MKKVTLDIPEKRELGDASEFVAQAKALTVTDAASQGRALALAKYAKENIDIIVGKLAKVKAEAFSHHRSICKLETDECAPWQEIFKIADGAATRYRLKAEAEAKAEQERVRVQNLKAEEDRRLQEAVLLEQVGAPKEQVDKVLAAPVRVPAVVVAPDVAKVSGVSGTKKWVPDPDATDLKKFVKFLAQQPDDSAWWSHVEIVGTAYNASATAFKDKLAAMAPGLAAKERAGNSYR